MKRLILLAVVASSIATAAHADVAIRFDFGPPPPHGSFWEGAPSSLPERIHFLEVRMQRLHREGRIGEGEWVHDQEDLNSIRMEAAQMRRFDGGELTLREHNRLWARLNNLSGRLHWQASLGY